MMLCPICLDKPSSILEGHTLRACDECRAEIGEIRVWMRESGRADTLERAVELRKYELKGRKVLR